MQAYPGVCFNNDRAGQGFANDGQDVCSAHHSETQVMGIRIIRAFFFSLDGLKAAFRDEAAFRQELALCAIMAPLIIIVPAGLVIKLYLTGACLQLLLVELLNSAIEATVDRVSEDRHPLSKKAKDIGSAAVLIAIIHLFLAWMVALHLAYRA